MTVSVLTPTIPSRAQLLLECQHSVAAQTVPVHEHLVHLDEERRGCAWTMNHLAEQATGEWLLPLADDDLLLPGAISTLLDHTDQADVVYAPPLVWGNTDTHFWGDPPRIPSFALVRASLWRSLGGYDNKRRREEDRDLWMRAMNAGARFVKAATGPTWVYRFSHNPDGTPRNKSYANGIAT